MVNYCNQELRFSGFVKFIYYLRLGLPYSIFYDRTYTRFGSANRSLANHHCHREFYISNLKRGFQCPFDAIARSLRKIKKMSFV